MVRGTERKIRYRRGEVGRLRAVDGFLPPPGALVPREGHVKGTLSLSKRLPDYFKREAKKRRMPYQRMIRSPVDIYAERQEASERLLSLEYLRNVEAF